MRLRLTPGEKFWIGLAAYVAAADYILWRNKTKTLSGTFAEWCETPRGRAICAAGAGVLGSHLFLKTPLIPGINVAMKASSKWATHAPSVAVVTFTDPEGEVTLSAVTSETGEPSLTLLSNG